jgi:hypothetical protein
MRDGGQIELKEGWTSDLLAKDSRDILTQIFHDITAANVAPA